MCLFHCFGRRGPLLWLASGPRRPRAMFLHAEASPRFIEPDRIERPAVSVEHRPVLLVRRIEDRFQKVHQAVPVPPDILWRDSAGAPVPQRAEYSMARIAVANRFDDHVETPVVRRSRRHKRTGPHRARSRYPTARFVRSPPCSVGLPLALRGIGPPHSSVNRDILWRHIPPSRFMFIRQDRGNSCRSSKIRSYSAGYGSAQAATPYPVFVSEAGECKPLTTTGPS